MPKANSGFVTALLLACLFIPALVSAQDRSVVQFGRSVRVEPGQQVGDVTCIMCSIYLRGPAGGDVTAIGGGISIESGVPVKGDVTAIGGDIRAQSGAVIGGDAVAIGGAVRREPDTQIGGDVTAMEGKGWLFLVFVFPFIILGVIVALIVWLVRYLFRTTTTPVAAR